MSLTQQEFDSINILHKVATDHGSEQDGLDGELCEAVQKAQRILMIRGGGRSYLQVKQASNTDKKEPAHE